jgi:metal-responsive CopG/Arc/MetJ family transcriptional regulator
LKERKEFVGIKLPKELVADLKSIAEIEDCNVSFIIRTITQDYINYYWWKNKEELQSNENDYYTYCTDVKINSNE